MAVPTFMGLRYAVPEIVIESRRRRGGVRTRDLTPQILMSVAQYWYFRIPLETGRDAARAEKVAAVIAHRDYHDVVRTWTLTVPQPVGLAIPSGNIVLSGAAAAGVEALPVRLPASAAIFAGQFFTVGTGAKVYKAAEKLASSGNLKITPPLRSAEKSGAALNFAPVATGRYAVDSDFATRYTRPVIPPRVVLEFEEGL